MSEQPKKTDFSDVESRRSTRTRRTMSPGRRLYYALGMPLVRALFYVVSATYRVQKVIGSDIGERIIVFSNCATATSRLDFALCTCAC